MSRRGSTRHRPPVLGEGPWAAFVALVTAVALFFACFAAADDASIFWGQRPSLGPVWDPPPSATTTTLPPPLSFQR